VAAVAAWAPARAEPPADVYAKLVALGRVVDAPGTTAIYGPILKNQSYKGAVFTRNLHYGPEPRAVLDVATPSTPSRALRPVMIYVPGGGGNKRLDYPGGEPFYDNIGLAAVRHGMIPVIMQRRSPPGGPWDSGAHDIAEVIQWVHANIDRYGGDPRRIVIWGQSAGSNNLSNYLTHKEYWGPNGVGVKAALLMSGGYNLAPMETKSRNSAPRGPGDGGAAAVANPAPPPPALDPAVRLQRSTLPGFKTLKIKMFVTAAELDPEQTVEATEMLRDVLCKAGNCPTYLLSKKQSHISEVQSINSEDKGVEAPVFAWFKRVL
jgi:triacylglycerol lipase